MQGLLLVDKPAGMTSHDVVARVRKLAGTRRVGHAGTLDPQATGLLVVAVGEATRWLDWLPSDKRYQAGLRFGLETDTQDIWGKAVAQKDATGLQAEAVSKALRLLQEIETQVPPMVSALKKDGQRLYDLARQGMTVERAARPVNIREIRLLDMSLPDLKFEVACSAGTYVRTLCHDLGQSLGPGACMTSLVRTASGPFRLEQAATLADLEKAGPLLPQSLKSADEALAHLPALDLDAEGELKVERGQPVAFPGGRGPGGQNRWRLRRADGSLAALGVARSRGIQPDKVFKREPA
jgi:tRNA pseudouridine55 synthase